MADLLVTVGRIVELAWSIKKAVETVRHNEEECRVIEKRVGRVSRLIRRIQEEVTEATSSKLSGDLEDLVEALDSALKLVTECQKRRRLSRFIALGGMADKLRRVQTEISDATMIILLALNVRATVILENIENAVHRPPPAPQHHMVQSPPSATIEYDEEEEEDFVGGPTTTHNGELRNVADHETTVLFDPSKVTNEVTKVSTQDEVKDVGNGSHSTNVNEISGSSETVTLAGEETGLKLTASIAESKNIWPNGSGALDISSGSTNTTEVHETQAKKDENATEPCGSVYVEGELNVFGSSSNFFAFFIPTGCFNIFRIFKRSDVNQEVHVRHPSHETSKNLGSWLLSYFQRVDNQKIPAYAGLLTQTDGAEQEQIPSSKHAGDPKPSIDSKGPIPHIIVLVLLGNETPTASMSLSILSAEAAAMTHFKRFSLSELEDATHNFLEDKIVRRGAFVTVCKGALQDGPKVAIKKIKCSHKLSKHICDILSHVSKFEHKNIARLLGHGYRVEERATGLQDEKDRGDKDDLFLVEEYITNGSLDRIIYGSHLDWSFHLLLIQRIAHGLHYLLEQQIIHLDLKPNNILIDYEMNPNITDFSRSRMLDQGDEVTTRDTDYSLASTMGYMPPEYIMECVVSKMYDVYSFGVTFLEIITGMCRSKPAHRQASIEWAWAAREAGRMEELLDLSLCLGLLCTQSDREDQPTMVNVVEMLDSKKELPTTKQPKYTKGRSV